MSSFKPVQFPAISPNSIWRGSHFPLSQRSKKTICSNHKETNTSLNVNSICQVLTCLHGSTILDCETDRFILRPERDSGLRPRFWARRTRFRIPSWSHLRTHEFHLSSAIIFFLIRPLNGSSVFLEWSFGTIFFVAPWGHKQSHSQWRFFFRCQKISNGISLCRWLGKPAIFNFPSDLASLERAQFFPQPRNSIIINNRKLNP